MLHDRRRGMFDLFRMSPIASGDLLTGKYAAFALLGTVVALGGARRPRVRLRRAVPGRPGRRRRRGGAAGAGVDRHRHRRRPGVGLGPPGGPGRAARPARLGVLQRPRARPRPVLGPGARRERAAAGDAGGLPAAGPDAARRDDPGVARDRAGRDGRRSCSWPGGSSSGASSTGRHEPVERPRRRGRHADASARRERAKGRNEACGDLAHADLRFACRVDRRDRRRGRSISRVRCGARPTSPRSGASR